MTETPAGADQSETNAKPQETSDTHPFLQPTPRDPLMDFLLENEILESDWARAFGLKAADIKDVSRKETTRQNVLYEVIYTEFLSLRNQQITRYLYKYRLFLDLSMSSSASLNPNLEYIISNFPGYEDIYHANKTLLYDPLRLRSCQKVRGCLTSGTFSDTGSDWPASCMSEQRRLTPWSHML